MRFCEYNINVPSNAPHSEFVLNSNNASDISNRRLVWSISKICSEGSGQTNNIPIWTRAGRGIKQVCSDLFLPVGYPDTVANGYIEYQIYDSIQGLCSYLRGVVSTGAVLKAAGVGDAEATAMSAAMTWAIRDGLGMIGGLMFSYFASPHFDAHVKEFRLLADVLNDIGLTLDMALPFLLSFDIEWLGSPYLILTSCSTLCKVACGISAGATKGNITDHFSIRGNRADVNAKESTQETLVSLMGMALGVWLTKFLHSLEKSTDLLHKTNCGVGEADVETTCSSQGLEDFMITQTITWAIFLMLTFIHVWANYIGVQRLHLRTLNYERARVTLQSVVEECGRWIMATKHTDRGAETSDAMKLEMHELVQQCTEKLPSPEALSESLWKSMIGMFFKENIRLGIRVRDLFCVSSARSVELSQELLEFLQGEFDNEAYMIIVECSSTRQTVSVMMRLCSTQHDELKAFFHANLLMWVMKQNTANPLDKTFERQLVTRSHKLVNQFFSENKSNLASALSNQGWDVSRLYLGFSGWKVDWDFDIRQHKD